MINIFQISFKGTIKEVMDYLKGIDICTECNGNGGGHADYRNSDGNVERGTGDWENCWSCSGTGKEPDEEIINERICCA